jgi:hypothetical protein
MAVLGDFEPPRAPRTPRGKKFLYQKLGVLGVLGGWMARPSRSAGFAI